VLTGPRDSAAYSSRSPASSPAHSGGGGAAAVTIIDDPPEVARRLVRGMDAVREFRRRRSDSYNFNWLLSIQPQFQQPFEVTHATMRALQLKREQPPMSSPPTCGARFRGSSPATSRSTGSRRSSARVRTSSPAILDHAAAR